ncbi:thiol reductant ABC exporter subunit CydD [Frigoribacterium sp. 2-23]|uniref:thiol reductant ABC exporter subunit CydD n=1 Tax=Frigoribacterium sp. 2-23 TaxID=3415006 RepID=UPI003C705FE1
MKPLDPRLLRYATAVRALLAGGAVLGLVQTASIIAVAWFVTQGVVSVVDGTTERALAPALLGLSIAILVRSVVTWALEAVAARAAVRAKSQLRAAVLETVTTRGRAWLAGRSSARVATLVGPGLDALDDYFARYLPQLILTALATPVLIVVMLLNDWLSAVIVLITIPLIPLFMVLIGWSTRAAQARQWDRLASLASSFLDAVNGLSTLKVFGRERRQIDRIGRLTDGYRVETMKTLRVSFLSGFALEMAASLSVALVAVSIGIRLVDGSLGLTVGLFVLLLTPEAYLPLRLVGANYHAAADGVAAADEVFEILEAGAEVGSRAEDDPFAAAPRAGRPDFTGDLVVDGLAVTYGAVQALAATSFRARRGTLTAVTGPSGVGKSSLVGALLGTVPHTGRISWHDSGDTLRRDDIAWSGQQAGLMGGTVAENVALGDLVDDDAVAGALDRAGAGSLDPSMRLGPGGTGLSGGQAQRVALARALYRLERRQARVLLVDEPSSALDSVTEARVVEGLRRAADDGAVVIVVTHRLPVAAAADVVVHLTRAAASIDERAVVS